MRKTLAIAGMLCTCATVSACSTSGRSDSQLNASMVNHHMKMMDMNGDGISSEEEWDAGHSKMFATADTNRDGTVSKPEMMAAMKTNMVGMGMNETMLPMMVDHQMQMMDANGDGMLTMDEHTAGAKKMFKMADSNGDMTLSNDEMMGMHMKSMKMMDGNGGMMKSGMMKN